MDFLGSLGIDIKLLIAQIINFGLLLWLLARFLYKPIIKRIEKDETELKQARIQKEELDLQKNAFAEQRKKETAEVKKRAREIIKEAESVSVEIEKEIHKRAEKEAKTMIAQSKNKLESLKPAIEKEIFKRMRGEIGNSFKESFESALSPPSQKGFQNVFWTDFVQQIRGLALQELREPNLAGVLEKFNLAVKRGSKKKDALKKELEEILAQKIGPVALEYAYPLTAKQEKELEKIVLEKSVVKINITKRQNRDLINGFRFEIAGMIIESNLLNIINDAANFKK